MFEIPAWTPGFRGMPTNETIRRVGLFTTPNVSPGHHTVEVINLGNAETVPLSFDYIYVQHGDVDASTATDPPPAVVGSGAARPTTRTSTPSPSTSAPTGAETSVTYSSVQKSQLGPIIGGGVGVAVVLALAGLLVYRCLRKRKQSKYSGTETRITPQEFQVFSMQSRRLAADTTVYTMVPADDRAIAPFILPMSTWSGERPFAIPPEKRRLLPESTFPDQGMASSSTEPPQYHAGRATSLPLYATDPGQPQRVNSRRKSPPPHPRRLPPRLPPL